jgi:hypothetical protein
VRLEPIHYRAPDEPVALLGSLGLSVKRHRMTNILPDPPIVYVYRCRGE